MKEIIMYVIITIILVVAILCIAYGVQYTKNVMFNGNKQVIDTNIRFDKCITYLGNEKIEIDIDKWNDYEGEQIQIIDKNGNVYLLSSFNTMLVMENRDK